MLLHRRSLMIGLGLLLPTVSSGQVAPIRLTLATAGQGSAFLPYGEGIARVIERSREVAIEVRQTGGSIENLQLVETTPSMIATAFLGSVHEAVTGTGFANGRRFDNIRALFPMYETAFMTAALRTSGITTIAALNGRRVGTGPARGPAEAYFRALAEIAGVTPVIVSGSPSDLAQQLLAGTIDALWQGAVVPIPSLVQVANTADVVVFGLSPTEVDAMRRRFPFMSSVSVLASSYRGQSQPLQSVAAWNFVVGHRELPDAVAEALTRHILSAPDLVAVVGPAARGTRADAAGTNGVVPFHPGAARALRALGATIP